MSEAASTQLVGSFVGRAEEIRSVRAAVDAALTGAGSGVIVVGEAGMGKTRLAAEVVARTRSAGVRVVWAAGWEAGAARAHWHWVKVLRALAADHDRQSLLRMLGPDAAELGRLVPDLRAGVQLTPPADTEGDDPRFAMYDAVSSFLRREASREPLLVVLDDLHAADAGSLRLLRFVVAETIADRLAILATTRDPDLEPLGDEVVGALVDVQRALPRVRLTGLSHYEVLQLLGLVVEPEEAVRHSEAVHRRSGGNPLFAAELGRLLATQEGGDALPSTIRAVLDRRLTAVRAPSLEVLRAAAVVGESFTVPLIEQASGAPREQILDALDRGVRANVVAAQGGAAFSFTHALVREALYGQLTVAARARLHRRIAEILETQVGGQAPLAELARHFLAGAPAVDDGKAADYAQRAGRRAAEQFAYEDAVAHFRSALSVLGPAGDASRRIELLIALGEAELRSGDLDAAREAFVEAADRARVVERADLLARAALELGSGLDGFEVRLFDHTQIGLLEEALNHLDPAPSSLRAWATARLSVALTFAESPVKRLQLADEAITMARAIDEPRALAYAMAARGDAIAGPEHIQERIDAATQIARLAHGAGDRGMELLGRRMRVIALLESGDIAGVDAEIERYQLLADALGQPLYQWYVPLWRGMRALMEGRIPAVWRHHARAAIVGARAQSHNAALNAEVLAWNTLSKEGHWAEAARRLAEQLPLASGIYSETFWVALVTPHLHRAEATAALDRFAAERFARFPRDAIWLAAMTYAADSCRAVGHPGAAEQLYELILPYRSCFAVDAIGAACYGSMARPLGVIATVLGRRADAISHFEEALDVHRACGAAALVAETQADLGAAQQVFGDHEAAQRSLDEARTLYRSLGMGHRADLVSETADTGVTADSPARNDSAEFRCEGEYWTVAYWGRTARIADAKGLRDIALLLRSPGQEFHVADIIAAGDPAGDRVATAVRAAIVRPGSVDAVIDDQAKTTYRRRLVELRDELDEAEANADLGRAEAVRAAMDTLSGQLAAAFGLGGRSRSQSDAAERARKAVTQRIRNALHRLEKVHPELAAHLERSVRTGRFCSYQPERIITWSL